MGTAVVAKGDQMAKLRDEEHAAELLAQAYLDAPYKEKKTQLVLFGIRYADDLQALSLPRIAELAHEYGLYATSNVEVSMGRNLAKYVVAKK